MRVRGQTIAGVLIYLVVGLCLPVSGGEGSPPEVHLLAEGSPHETPYYVQDSGRPGPTVMLVGGIHGNEPAGWHAVEVVRYWPITRGKVISIPRANPTALDANQRRIPGAEGQSDLNRLFPKPDQGETLGPEAHPLATALWELTQEYRPDWLLDCHEGYDFSHVNPKSVGSSVISDRQDETREMADWMLRRINAFDPRPQQPFVIRGPPVAGSLARAASVHLGTKAMILETTTKSQRLPVRSRQHRALLSTFFHRLEMLPEEISPATFVSPLYEEGTIHVGLYDDEGVAGKGIPSLTEQLATVPEVRLVRIDGADIRSGGLAQFDAVIFSGGSGSGQSKSLEEDGRREVQDFVDRGGTYIGICAGGYLACGGFGWDLGLLNAKTKSSHWRRGSGQVLVEWTDEGRERLDRDEASLAMRYQNGPIWEPLGREDLPKYEVLALFREEVAENGSPPGIMVDSPAGVVAPYGQGRVLAFSCHPEQTPGAEDIVPRLVRLAGERRPVPVAAE